ncbi:MAG: septum site-determining protein MinC [Burkholderiales bacterium]|nr:septum site-determining protein MinC [Burkholderiales bacterium]
MSQMSIKLHPARFGYYILKISAHFDMEEFEAKMLALKDFDEDAKYIALELLELISEREFQQQMTILDETLAKNKLFICFVVSNPLINGTVFCGKPVVNVENNMDVKNVIPSTKMINYPVRSGIIIRNDGDIIVNELVSHNAEVISDSNIHVYNECRGKLIAGANGDKNAMIYVQRFNAEYISIANVFQVIEDKLPERLLNKAVKIFLDDKERLNVVSLN